MKIDLPIFQLIKEKISSTNFLSVSGLAGGSKAFFLLGLAEKLNCPILAVTKTEEESEELTEDLKALKVFFNIRKRINLYSAKISSEEIACLNEILENKVSLLVTSSQGLEKTVPKKEDFFKFCQKIEIKEEINRDEFIHYLISAGYERIDFVEQPGEYSVRGEIIDLWSANFDLSLRIIFFENKIEEIRLFDVTTQRTKENIQQAKIIPASLLRKEKQTSLALNHNGSGLAEYFSHELLIFWDTDLKKKVNLNEFSQFKQIRNIFLPTGESINFGAQELPSFTGKFSFFFKELTNWQNEKYQIYLYAQNQPEEEKLTELLEEEKTEITPPVLIGSLTNGFLLPEMKLVIVTGNDIFARYKIRYHLPKFKTGGLLEHLSEIQPGNYVVHERYGIGIYCGLERLLIENKYADFLSLKYKGGDRLYVPITDFRLVQKYLGPEGYRPRIYPLDGISWERIKQKIKESLYNFARELLQIYAQRQVSDGYSFPPDSYIEKEFSASFPYEETPDQAKAIEEVKNDLVSFKPMDRVVIGDVGYGKTEVAMRAALKVALAGKQVAVLVPTTILAEQHYRTFTERFKEYPVNIEMLSRFRTKKEQVKILADLKNGLIDIIIGTHRLLQKDVFFKDLGLAVTDEEHRFGVRAKEKLKKMRFSIDVLTLSATPIPRTLSMALSGLRAVSLIETPPEGRLPIETYICPYDKETVKNTILSEVNRGGQVFYVYNRIETILNVVNCLKDLLPQIEFGLAHGQMSSPRLEKTMHKFLNGEYKVLVSTSIIESGLDLPQVNTLIVENAEEFGLAQLYQLRGRVGRGDRKAYCYLFYNRDTHLSENTIKRLQAFSEFTTLGSGLRLALRDLEIRGAGNILGPQQHGFIGELGYDLYFRLLEQEIKKLKGEKITEEKEPVFDFPLDAYLPEDYITLSSTRIIFYKRILSVYSTNDLEEIKNELIDRFGEIPQPTENLFSLAELRLLAKKLMIKEIKRKKKFLEITFFPEATLDREKIKKFTQTYPEKISFIQGEFLSLNLYNPPQERIIFFLKKYLLNFIENDKI